MAQRKGQTGNPNGRPKGRPNKVTQTAREWITELIDDNRLQIEADLKTLTPKERLLILEKFMQYSIPKVQSAEAKDDDEKDITDIINEVLANGNKKTLNVTIPKK
ncbi:MAG: DUF5681 domain-containing protein [Bacteroidales bacterium]|jgi:hypothetical protein|nr:DUF5681 domain-containing protein [Bacteroidales bacterium]